MRCSWFDLVHFFTFLLSGNCGPTSSAFGQVSLDACSHPGYTMNLTNISDSDEVVECLANGSPDPLGTLFTNSCQLSTDEVVCDQCDCLDSCQRTCILAFNDNSKSYVVLTGLSSSGSETKALLQRIASSICLEQHTEMMRDFDDCSCPQTPTPIPSLLLSTNGKFD